MMQVPIGRGGKYGVIDVDDSKFPEHVGAFIYDYGIRQILNDAVSDKTDGNGNPLTDAEIHAKALVKYEQLLAGELRRRGTAAEPVDPVEREAYRMAKAAITEQFRKLGLWPKKGEDKFQAAVDARMAALNRDTMDESDYIAKWLEANPKTLAAAKRIVAERAKAENVDPFV